MKKLSFALVIAMVAVLLTGCFQGVVTSEMTITSIEGAGTKTIKCDIYKDEADKPDGTGKVADNFSGDNPYFLKPIDDVVAFLNSKAPEGVAVTMEEKADKYVLSFTYSFKDLADYNAKTKALIGEERWAASDMSEAAIEVVDAEGGKKVTFTEDIEVLKNSVRWAAEALISDTTGVYNSQRAAAEGLTADGSATSIFIIDPFTITVGDNTAKFDSSSTEISVTGFFADSDGNISKPDSEQKEDPAKVEETIDNPKTGDSIVVFSLLLVASAALLVVTYRRRVNN